MEIHSAPLKAVIAEDVHLQQYVSSQRDATQMIRTGLSNMLTPYLPGHSSLA